MWERFSYYGMRALLVYYMTKYLFFSQEKSSQIYGLYTGFVYFTPFFGGLFADRVLGQRKTVVLGGILMAIGQFMMCVPQLFFPALMFLIFGNGCFKPNISTQVGSLYPAGDSRRDGAFSIFYVGINVGAFFSPLVCGWLGETYGWSYGFGTAGIGMLVGLGVYLLGQKHLAPDNVMKRASGMAGNKARTVDPAGEGADLGPRNSMSVQHRLLGDVRTAGKYACTLGRRQYRSLHLRLGNAGLLAPGL